MRNRYLLCLLLWCWSAPAWSQAITIDNVTSAEAPVGTPGTVTFNSHAIAADANAVLIGVCERDTNASGYTVDTATVTVSGVSATQVIGQGNGASMRSVLFRLLAPATGSPSIVVNGDTGTDRMIVGVISLKNVASSSAFNTAGGVGAVGTTDGDIDGLASAADEFAVMVGCIRTATPTPSPDATAPVSTEQLDVAHTDATSVRVYLYTEAGAASSINMRTDFSVSADWAATAVSIRPGLLTNRRQPIVSFP